MLVSVCIQEHVHVYGCPQRTDEGVRLEVPVSHLMWVPGTELGSFGRTE